MLVRKFSFEAYQENPNLLRKVEKPEIEKELDDYAQKKLNYHADEDTKDWGMLNYTDFD